MQMWFVRKDNSLFRNIIMSLASSLVGAYMIMCMVWAVTGMRYNAVFCLKVFVIGYGVLLPVLLGISIRYFVCKRLRVRAIHEHSMMYGYDDEYYRMLEEHLGKPEENEDKLRFAAFYLEGRRFEDCRRMLESIRFSELDPRCEEEYFNLCLYSAVKRGDRRESLEIYSRARRYFDRAAIHSRGHIMHTLGELCLMNCQPFEARDLFLEAWCFHDRGLRFDCLIGLSRAMLMMFDREQAKEFCIKASRLARTRLEAEELRAVMFDIERAYRRSNNEGMIF